MNDRLNSFYPEGFTDKISEDASILLVLPSREYACDNDLKRLLLDKREVAITYPKDGIDIVDECVLYGAKLTLQLGSRLTKKIPFYDGGDVTDALADAIFNAVEDKVVGYHHHDEFSMRDAIGTAEQLGKILSSNKRKFMSVTNHGSIGGWIKQKNVCDSYGIKPIFGMEGYHNNYRGDDPEEKKKNKKSNHLILLAKTTEGYYNLIKIHNDAQLNGFYYFPRINDEALRKWGKGIIGTTACAGGEIPRLLIAGETRQAVERYHFYKSCFDEFYIELQLIESIEQVTLNQKLIAFAQTVGGDISLGFDSHYLYPELSDTHDVLMCIRQGKTVNDLAADDDGSIWQFSIKNLYYRNYEQGKDLFENGFIDSNGNRVSPFKDEVFTEDVFRIACRNTRKMAVSVEDINIDTSIKLPHISEDSGNVLRGLSQEGLKKKGLADNKEYAERLDYELDVICLSGWADYFLITKDMIDKARELQGEWHVGNGRGSSCGSLVAYCLDIVFIDPIKYGLLFERFLDFSRSEIKVNTFEV